MQELKDYTEITKVDKPTILLWKLEGCEACKIASESIPELETKYPNVDFQYQVLSESTFSNYEKYGEKQPLEIIAEDEGEPILGLDGKPLIDYKRNEDGSLKLEVPMIAPSFYFYVPQERSESNPEGFVGGLNGFNKEQIENVLESILGTING